MSEQGNETGTITRLVRQQKDPDRVSVFVDGAFALGVHMDLVAEFGLAVGRRLTGAERARLAEADAVYRARAAAYACLAYRARTEAELRRKLREKGFDEAVITPVLDRLRSLGYLDDAAYARQFARARLDGKGHGPRRIRADLRRRGVAPALIEAALTDTVASDDLLAQARRHAEKCRKRLARETDPRKRRRKLTAFLLRRGFDYETVRRVVDDVEAG